MVPGSVRAAFPSALPEAPEPLDALLAALDRTVVPASSHWQHPGWFGYFPANASLHSLLGDLFSGGLGAQGMLWSTSPAATEVEQALMDALADALGLDPAFTFGGGGGGVIQDSASSAALVALLAALHRANPTWRDDGVDGRDRVYVTAETHSSLAKAVRVAGLGARALRVVGFRPGTLAMDPAALAALVAEDRGGGLRPVLVCPTVGTTGTGAIDPVREVVDAARRSVGARRRGLGRSRRALPRAPRPARRGRAGRLVLHRRAQVARHGVRRVAAVGARRPRAPGRALDHPGVPAQRGDRFGRGRRLPRLAGAARAAASARSSCGRCCPATACPGCGPTCAATSRWPPSSPGGSPSEPGFTLAAPPSLGLVCLRLDSDERTRAALAQVNASGRAFLTHTVVDGRVVIRVAIGGVTTEREHVVALWEQLRKAAASG